MSRAAGPRVNLDALLDRVTRWREGREALVELSALPLATKRAEVYPRVVELAVGYWCDADGASYGGTELAHIVEFVERELAITPELVEAIWAALADRRVRFQVGWLFVLVRRTRDRRALPLLAPLARHSGWAGTILAVDGHELVDELLAAFADRPPGSALDFAIAAGFLGGERAVPVLLRMLRDDNFGEDIAALGLALAGPYTDAAMFRALSTRGLGAMAKRIHAVTCKPNVADRLAALDTLARHLDPALPALLACCRLLTDVSVELVERAAGILREYAAECAACHVVPDHSYHAAFLAQARAAIANGVTEPVRAALVEVWRSIPRAGEPPAGPPLRLAALDSLRETIPERGGVHREPALEALIAEDPDDPQRYLVYADWLQTRGDARGTLIALHDRLRRDPRDEPAGAAASALLHEHASELLETLAGRDESQIELAWYLGFITSARLRYRYEDDALAGLATLLQTRSAMFVQTIVIHPRGRGTPDAARFCEVLLAHAPPTLSHLQIGRPGTWTVTPALCAAFPRLERDPAAAWIDALEAVRAHRKLAIEIDAAALSPLVPCVAGVTADVPAILLGLKAELHLQRPIGMLAALPRVFTPGSLDAFTLALAEQSDRGDTLGWGFGALGALGGERCTRYLAAGLPRWPNDRQMAALGHLCRIGSDAAVAELAAVALAARSEDPAVPDTGLCGVMAEQLLDKLAAERGCDVDQIIDRAAPTRGGAALQILWLAQLMLHGHRIATADFRAHVVGNPVRQPLAASLVWGEFSGDRLVELFAVARDGTLRDVEGMPHALSQPAVGVVHPAELAGAQLAEWQATFERRAIPQVVAQLARPVARLSPDELRGDRIVRFASRRAEASALAATLRQRGWYTDTEDDGRYETLLGFRRHYRRQPLVAVARLDGGERAIAAVDLRDRKTTAVVPLASVHPVILAELLADLEAAHGRTGRPPGLVVERARTGRARCVVCRTAIERDTPRIGVERMLDTPSFTGRGLVWAHPACRAGLPELAGVDLDADLAELA